MELVRDLRVRVLDAVGLVDDDVLEAQLLEGALLNQAQLVSRDAHVEVLRKQAVRDQLCALVLGTRQRENIKARRPLLELARPILQSRLRNDHQVRAMYVTDVFKVGEERDGLERLSEAHLVGEYTVEAIVV